MAEKRNGAGSRVAGLLERAPLESPPVDLEETEASGPVDLPDVEPMAARGRGAVPRKAKTADARAAKRIKGRTIYIPDDLFERIIVQAHRRNRTISEYVVSILDRQVPDHRVIRGAESSSADVA
jgi:hypothetical protein